MRVVEQYFHVVDDCRSEKGSCAMFGGDDDVDGLQDGENDVTGFHLFARQLPQEDSSRGEDADDFLRRIVGENNGNDAAE